MGAQETADVPIEPFTVGIDDSPESPFPFSCVEEVYDLLVGHYPCPVINLSKILHVLFFYIDIIKDIREADICHDFIFRRIIHRD